MTLTESTERGVLASAAAARRETLAGFLGIAGRIVIEAASDIVEALGHGLGQGKLVKFLNGADSAFLRENELIALPHYGVFGSMRRAWIVRLIEVMREMRYLEIEGNLRPVVAVTEEGDELLIQTDQLPLMPRDLLRDPVLGSACPADAMEERLFRLRARLGRLARRPPRQIVPDAIVRSLGRDRPKSREDLEARLPIKAKPHADAFWGALTSGADAQAACGAAPEAIGP